MWTVWPSTSSAARSVAPGSTDILPRRASQSRSGIPSGPRPRAGVSVSAGTGQTCTTMAVNDFGKGEAPATNEHAFQGGECGDHPFVAAITRSSPLP